MELLTHLGKDLKENRDLGFRRARHCEELEGFMLFFVVSLVLDAHGIASVGLDSFIRLNPLGTPELYGCPDEEWDEAYDSNEDREQ